MRVLMLNDLKRIIEEPDFELEGFAKEFFISLSRASSLVEYAKAQPFDDTNTKGVVLWDSALRKKLY